jgi:formate/nitrite transporter FocA (FNT family)
MYFIPFGLLVESTEAVPDAAGLTWGAFLWDNLIPVTLGNVVGGALMVGAIYWFVYLRPRPG